MESCAGRWCGVVEVIVGDARRVPLADASVQCCVSSPPYYRKRDYGVAGQIGLERSVQDYVAQMVQVYREVWRVLRDDGVAFVNLGDTYANDAKWGGASGGKHVSELHGTSAMRERNETGLRAKNLIGIPWRVAFALQDDGWILRSDIVWEKGNCMPESVKDRPTCSHEYVFLLAKQERYFYDAAAIATPIKTATVTRAARGNSSDHKNLEVPGRTRHSMHEARAKGEAYELPTMSNARSVWHINTVGYAGAHFATMPLELAQRCIKAGSSEGGCCPKCGAPYERVVSREFIPQRDVSREQGVRGAGGQKPMDQSNGWEGYPRGTTAVRTKGWAASCECNAGEPVPCVVFDPFAGAGTTLLAAHQLGRRAVGVELNPVYARMARERVQGAAPLFFGGEQSEEAPAVSPSLFEVVEHG